jgi:hypothetical protein
MRENIRRLAENVKKKRETASFMRPWELQSLTVKIQSDGWSKSTP